MNLGRFRELLSFLLEIRAPNFFYITPKTRVAGLGDVSLFRTAVITCCPVFVQVVASLNVVLMTWWCVGGLLVFV